jgi:nucleoside-triphosphatase THEP1
MRIMNANEVIESTGLTVLIYGEPGVGKTTLANTAKNAIVLDFDKGSHRASYQQRVVQFESWQDLLQSKNELDVLLESCDCVIVDTIGTLLDSINSHIIETQPLLAKNSIKVWGELKKSFTDFFAPLRKMNKNLIFIAHAKEKDEGDVRIKRPLIQGSSYDLLMQTCDLIGYYAMKNNVRTLSFDLSDTVTAKNCAGLEPIQVRNLESMPDLLSNILDKTRASLNQRIEKQTNSIQIIRTWTESARKLTKVKSFSSEVIQQFMQELKSKSLEFPSGTSVAIWASIKPIFENAGYEWDAENQIFNKVEEKK